MYIIHGLLLNNATIVKYSSRNTTRYYCSGKATTNKPTTSEEGGGKCGPGTMCPEGSSASTNCQPGIYVCLSICIFVCLSD